MDFNETISPLSHFLMANHFSIVDSSHNFIKYTSESMIITLAYNGLEHLFYTHIGQHEDLLTELTPLVIKAVFDEDSFQFQSTLTIENLVSFLKGKGNLILMGDAIKLKKLQEFSDKRSKEFTETIMHQQYLKGQILLGSVKIIIVSLNVFKRQIKIFLRSHT